MSRSPRDPGGTDAERDAWLREALRHAPDASASAPSGVRDAILRQARQATAGAATTGRDTRPGPRLSWWSWLMQPSVAAGFASVMVATLVGVMWWGRPIDEPLREANLPDAPTRAAAPAMAPAPSDAPAAPATAAAPAVPAAADRPAAPTVPAATPPSLPPRAQASAQPVPPPGAVRPKATTPDQRAARREEHAAEERAAEKDRRSARMMAEESTRREALASDVARVSPAPAPPAPMSPPQVSPAPALPATAGVTAAAPAERQRVDESADGPRSASRAASALADSATNTATDSATHTTADMPSAKAAPPSFPAQPGAERSPAAARAQAPARDTGAGAAPGAAVANLSRAPHAATELAAGPAPTANPVVHLRSAVAGAPGAWSWQRDGGPELPMNDAVQAWLGRLDDATRSRWQAGPAGAGSAGQTLRLLRDGRLHTTLHVEAGAVRLEAAAQAGAASVPRAPLPAAAVEALATALEGATR